MPNIVQLNSVLIPTHEFFVLLCFPYPQIELFQSWFAVIRNTRYLSWVVISFDTEERTSFEIRYEFDNEPDIAIIFEVYLTEYPSVPRFETQLQLFAFEFQIDDLSSSYIIWLIRCLYIFVLRQLFFRHLELVIVAQFICLMHHLAFFLWRRLHGMCTCGWSTWRTVKRIFCIGRRFRMARHCGYNTDRINDKSQDRSESPENEVVEWSETKDELLIWFFNERNFSEFARRNDTKNDSNKMYV